MCSTCLLRCAGGPAPGWASRWTLLKEVSGNTEFGVQSRACVCWGLSRDIEPTGCVCLCLSECVEAGQRKGGKGRGGREGEEGRGMEGGRGRKGGREREGEMHTYFKELAYTIIEAEESKVHTVGCRLEIQSCSLSP